MKKHILVTGSHRSGSTWTGKVIARAPNVRYIQEPFNIAIKRYNSPFKYWFQFLDNNPVQKKLEAKNYIDSFIKVRKALVLNKLLKSRTPKAVYGHILDIKRRITHRTVIKDPIAIMSAEWLYHNYDIDVVVLLRHPAAFVASLKVKNWKFDFKNYLDQPDLMNTNLEEYQKEIEEFANTEKDIIDQGILLWNTIYATIFYYKNKYKDNWYFVKHEDLSAKPIEEFKKMFFKIQLEFDKNVEDYIVETTKSSTKSDLKRDSKENIKTWKERLSEEEINRIKIGTKKVWEKFYAQSDW